MPPTDVSATLTSIMLRFRFCRFLRQRHGCLRHIDILFAAVLTASIAELSWRRYFFVRLRRQMPH